MTALDLYKFMKDNEVEMRWDEKTLSVWVDFSCLEKFATCISPYISRGGVEVTLLQNCIHLDIVPLCEYFGIDPEIILQKEE